MVIYRFDGSFDGLLTAVFDSFARKERPDALLSPDGDMPLFYDTLHEVETDLEKAHGSGKNFQSQSQPVHAPRS